jgi:U3 small nucleolar RNA-associated protein 10
VVDAIIDTTTSRKYAILGAIVDSMPSNAAETMASIAYHLLLSSCSKSREDDGSSWQQDAAFNMLSKRKKVLCVSALGGMLQLCIGCSKKSKFSILHQANAIAKKVLTTNADALRRLQEQSSERSSELVESYEIIMQSILIELQTVGRCRAKNSDPLLIKLEDGAYSVLDSLMDTMNPVQFINSLIRSLSFKEMTDAMRRKSLHLISHVVTMELSAVDAKDPAFQLCVHDAVGALVLLVQDAEGQTDICRQMALETLTGFIQRFAAHYKDVFLQAIPPVVELSREADLPGIRGMALICIASFVNSMKDAVIPMVPPMIQSVIGSMNTSLTTDSGDREASDAENAAALAALSALSEHLAAFLAPNLPNIMEILLQKDLCISSADVEGAKDSTQANSPSPHNVQALAGACRSKIASSISSRLLVAPLSSTLDSIMDGARNDPAGEKRSTLHLMDMLATVIINMDSTAVATYGSDVFSMVLKGLDTRRVYGASSMGGSNVGRSKDLAAIEAATVNCMLQLVLKLNETKFKPIFYRLLEWATRSPPGETESSLSRKIAFFHVINVLTENLKSVFTTYFSALLEPFLDALLYEADEEDEEDISAVNTLQLMAMRSLTRCFMYDTSEFLNEATFDKLLEPLINLMKAPRQRHRHASSKANKATRGSKSKQVAKPSEAATELFASIDANDPLIENTISGSCPEWMRAELSTFSRTIVACVSQMAMASGMNNGEARWRPLHHAVLMATRANTADSRCTALETVMAMFTTLQEEYLVLVPEALPFLSELLEDEDARVEKRTVEILNAMSEKSGEDLQQYLTT